MKKGREKVPLQLARHRHRSNRDNLQSKRRSWDETHPSLLSHKRRILRKDFASVGS